MALDTTPWFIGDPGAEHSAEVCRLAANAPGGSDDGVFAPGDCKVSPLATPGSSVRIGPGAWKGMNRASSSVGQAFLARVISDTNVAIAATGAGAGRSDLVCLVVRDPSIPGSGGTVGGPYHQTLVVSGVSSTATRLQSIAGYENVTGYALARVTLPVSTATVQAAHITDLRRLASPNTAQLNRSAPSTGTVEASNAQPIPTGGAYATWPPQAVFSVPIPPWATHAVVRGDVDAYKIIEGWVQGRVRGVFCGVNITESSFDQVTGVPDTYRDSVGFMGEVAIASQYRGTTQTLTFQGYRTTGTGRIVADVFTISKLSVAFEERVS